MQLVIEKDGRVRGIYGEAIDLAALGPARISRASHVEPNDAGLWVADLLPVGGPVLGPFERRSDALNGEVAWLEVNWLIRLADGRTGPGGGKNSTASRLRALSGATWHETPGGRR